MRMNNNNKNLKAPDLTWLNTEAYIHGKLPIFIEQTFLNKKITRTHNNTTNQLQKEFTAKVL